MLDKGSNYYFAARCRPVNSVKNFLFPLIEGLGKKTHGQRHYLWRAVDEEGQILDILVQKKRNAGAAKRFFKKIIKKQGYTPRVVVTDKLKSHSAAMRELGLKAKHRQDKGLNNRAELSHQWTRVREKKMRKFKSAGQAQKFLSAFELIYQQTQPKRHKFKAIVTRIMNERENKKLEGDNGTYCVYLRKKDLFLPKFSS